LGLIEVIKYKEDNENSDFRLKMIIGIVIVALILILFFQDFLALIIISFIASVGIYFCFIPDGQMEIYFYDKKLFFKKIEKGKKEFCEIKNIEYRWSYNYVPTIQDVKANDFTIIRMEIITEEGEEYFICRELSLWESVPVGWNYQLFNKKHNTKILVTSNNLFSLKTRLESKFLNP